MRRQPDGPRERLERVGPAALADHELVALVLRSGLRGRHVTDVARDVLARADGLAGLTRLSADDVRRTRGIGAVRAAQLVAAIELGRRCVAVPTPDRPTITSARGAAAVLIPRFGAMSVEVFGFLALDRRRRLTRVTLVSQGNAEQTAAHPRHVFRLALQADASAVVLFHTHPSGDPTPSSDDVAVTRRLILAGEVLGVPVLDHVVVAQATYFSFQESGLLGSFDHGLAGQTGGPAAPTRSAERRRSRRDVS